jgi:hypothetical protein
MLPSATAYREAMRAARARGLSIDHLAAKRIARALEEFARELERALRAIPPGQGRAAAARSVEVVRQAANDLERAIVTAVREGRDLSAEHTLDVWRKATERVARERDIPDALLGAIVRPELTTLHAFEALRAPETWRTLVRSHVVNAATEAAAIMRDNLARGVAPDTIARALGPYVRGSERLPREFLNGAVTFSELPAEQQKAARAMRHNATRIAFSETHNARREAEVFHFQNDPLISLARWTLSPNRGTQTKPDVCDALATLDWYGLGPGVYPLTKVPTSPHPWDRCEVLPLTRPLSELHAPKRTATLQLDPGHVALPFAHKLTPRAVVRIRAQLVELLGAGAGTVRL